MLIHIEKISPIEIIKILRIGKINIDNKLIHASTIRHIQIILNIENEKIYILDNDIKLKNTFYNKIGIIYVYISLIKINNIFKISY